MKHSEYTANLQLSRTVRAHRLRAAYVARRTAAPWWLELAQWLASPAQLHHYMLAAVLLTLIAV